MAKAMTIDEFMNSSTMGPRGNFLTQPKKWAIVPDTKPPLKGVNVVLHMKNSIYMVWRHGVPKLHINDKKEVEIWGANYVCWEAADVLINQTKRDDDGIRKVPPRTCGICKMIEWVYQQVANGELSWTEEIFRFEATKSRDNRIVHAGGLTNMFGNRKLTDEQKDEMKEHGIYQDEAWMENGMAKANYVFLVVDYDDVPSGTQIAVMAAGLGDKVQTAIAHRRRSLGMDEGNPMINPFVMQWTYNEKKGVEFNKKYDALPIEKLIVTDEIMELIQDDPPSVEGVMKPHNALEVRAALEEACLIEMPWDEFFGKSQAKAEQTSREDAGGRTSRGEERPKAAEKPKAKRSEPMTAPDEEEGEEFDCGSCDKGPVPANAKKCPFCGVRFEAEEPEPEPEPVEPPRRKKAAAAPKEATPPPAGKGSSKAPQGSGKTKRGGAFPDNDDEDVPFIFIGSFDSEAWWPWS